MRSSYDEKLARAQLLGEPRYASIVDASGSDAYELRCYVCEGNPSDVPIPEGPLPHRVSLPCGCNVVVGTALYAKTPGRAPRLAVTGWWMRFIPVDVPDPLVRRALSACYVEGYRTLEELRSMSDADLLLLDGVSALSVCALRKHLGQEPDAKMVRYIEAMEEAKRARRDLEVVEV